MEKTRNDILKFYKNRYIKIPISIILNTDLNAKRVLVLSYFLIHITICNIVNCNIDMIIDYFNLKKPNKKSKFKKDIIDIVLYLVKNDYLFLINCDIDKIIYMDDNIISFYVNTEKLENETFGIIYMDEIYKIKTYSSYKNVNQLKIYMLLLLSYIRYKIPINHHESYDYIEAYNGFYKSISDKLGNATYKYISDSFDILQELEIIYHEQIKRFKNKQGYWINAGLVFANIYKRIFRKNKNGTYNIIEIRSGEEYYKKEIDRKIKSIHNYYYKTSKPLN